MNSMCVANTCSCAYDDPNTTCVTTFRLHLLSTQERIWGWYQILCGRNTPQAWFYCPVVRPIHTVMSQFTGMHQRQVTVTAAAGENVKKKLSEHFQLRHNPTL